MDTELKECLKDILLRSRKIPESDRPKWVHLNISEGRASYRIGEDLDQEVLAEEIENPPPEKGDRMKFRGVNISWLED